MNGTGQSIVSHFDVTNPHVTLSSTVIRKQRAFVGRELQTHAYMLQETEDTCLVCRSVSTSNTQWEDSAEVAQPPGKGSFMKQLVKINDGLVVGMITCDTKDEPSCAGLWALDIRQPTEGAAPVTAAEMAGLLSWRRVLRFPALEDHGGIMCPCRFLAPGPRQGQVIVFALDSLTDGKVRPRLLVEFEGKACKFRYLSSIEYVPRWPRDACERSDGPLLPTVIRTSATRGGTYSSTVAGVFTI